MNLQFEVPTFEAHQHAAKIFPGDLPALNNNERHVAILGIVPFDPSPYDAICDLQAMFLVGEMFRGEGAADPLDQAAKQHEQIVFRISDNLEPVAGRMFVTKFEAVEGYPRSEQMRAKVKLVELAVAIGEADRSELGVFKIQPTLPGYLLVKALAAKLFISLLYGAIVDDVVARCDLATSTATNLVFLRELASIHIHAA